MKQKAVFFITAALLLTAWTQVAWGNPAWKKLKCTQAVNLPVGQG